MRNLLKPPVVPFVLEQPQRFLLSVNRLFYENTADSAFATLFFAEYNDKSGRLRYANCGRLPALLLRQNDQLERLEPTCTVLGLFKGWDCCAGEGNLSPGDNAFYTDGVTESFNRDGEEFGRISAGRSLTPPSQLAAAEPACLARGLRSELQPSRTTGRHHHAGRRVQITQSEAQKEAR